MTEVRFQRPVLYQKQFNALYARERYSVIEASTKSGKTHGAIVWLFEEAAIKGKPGRNYWWVAPIVPQAKIAYRRMKRAIPNRLRYYNDSELTITLTNGAMIWFKGSDRPDSLYGEDVYAAVLDEASRCREEAWHAVRSTLTMTRGPIRIIGNVKGMRNWAFKMARKAESGAPGYSFHKITAWDAVEAGVLRSEEIEDAKASLPERVFRELYLAEASDDEGRVYANFNAENVVEGSELTKDDVLIGMDFNVNPMTAVVAQQRGDQIHVIDEIVQRNSNTQKMAVEIQGRYSQRVIVYPDPSGKARKTAALNTDFAILEAHGFVVKAPNVAPRVEDRVNVVNAAFATTDGTRRLFVDSRCTELVDALWAHYYTDKGAPDKTSGYDHITDALGYLISERMPIAKRKARRLKVKGV